MDFKIYLIFLQLAVSCHCLDLQDFPEPHSLKVPMRTQFRMICTGLPPDPYPRAKTALQLPELAQDEPAMIRIIDDIIEGLQMVLQTRNEHTFAIHGTATTGMSAVLDNLIEPGDKVLALSIGNWGGVFRDMATRLGANVTFEQKTLGTRWYLHEAEKLIQLHRPQILTMVTGETAAATKQNLDGIGDLCQKYNCLLVIDEATTAGIQPIFMDKLKIDALATNSHKGLGGVPGLAPISFSTRAVNKIMSRTTPPRAYQTDFKLQYRMWNRSSTNRAGPHSISIPVFYSLREALATIADEGLRNVYRRHAQVHKQLAEGLDELGLTQFVKNNEDRMMCMNAVDKPKGKDTVKVANYIMNNFGIKISPGYGPLLGRVLRFATYAQNAQPERIRSILFALKVALNSPKTDE